MARTSTRHAAPAAPRGAAFYARGHGRAGDVLTLLLNGENRQFETPSRGPLSVQGLLVELGLDMRKVAVECNEEIVPRSRYAETWLASGDQLEIVHFIGGG